MASPFGMQPLGIDQSPVDLGLRKHHPDSSNIPVELSLVLRARTPGLKLQHPHRAVGATDEAVDRTPPDGRRRTRPLLCRVRIDLRERHFKEALLIHELSHVRVRHEPRIESDSGTNLFLARSNISNTRHAQDDVRLPLQLFEVNRPASKQVHQLVHHSADGALLHCPSTAAGPPHRSLVGGHTNRHRDPPNERARDERRESHPGVSRWDTPGCCSRPVVLARLHHPTYAERVDVTTLTAPVSCALGFS